MPDGLFAALKSQLGDERLLELTYITALYLQHTVMSRALRTEFDDATRRSWRWPPRRATRDGGRDINLPKK